jgi:uncharacterized membrane protein YbhN (UPF0104 family)
VAPRNPCASGASPDKIAGLTSVGIPQDQAVAAVFIERLCTAYRPPIWGWATQVWMRRSDYV